MSTVSLALMWHQHQPYYPDDVAGENPMPWVRLHGTKDYLGMALHLEEVPEFRCTINLVPSLLVQIEAYVQGATDQHLRVSRQPADGLDHDDALYLLDNFFMAHADAMIRPHPRYHELYNQARARSRFGRAGTPRFRERDLRDLQVWSNLSWMHPLLLRERSRTRRVQGQGKPLIPKRRSSGFSISSDALLAQIIPLHRKLADRGQVELTTTPFYHPIVPLLFDKRLAREAMPDVQLPGYRDGYLEDAEVHVKRAVGAIRSISAKRPAGMWPSEGVRSARR